MQQSSGALFLCHHAMLCRSFWPTARCQDLWSSASRSSEALSLRQAHDTVLGREFLLSARMKKTSWWFAPISWLCRFVSSTFQYCPSCSMHSLCGWVKQSRWTCVLDSLSHRLPLRVPTPNLTARVHVKQFHRCNFWNIISCASFIQVLPSSIVFLSESQKILILNVRSLFLSCRCIFDRMFCCVENSKIFLAVNVSID